MLTFKSEFLFADYPKRIMPVYIPTKRYESFFFLINFTNILNEQDKKY